MKRCVMYDFVCERESGRGGGGGRIEGNVIYRKQRIRVLAFKILKGTNKRRKKQRKMNAMKRKERTREELIALLLATMHHVIISHCIPHVVVIANSLRRYSL